MSPGIVRDDAAIVDARDAIASLVGDDLALDHVGPSALDPRVAPAVAAAASKL